MAASVWLDMFPFSSDAQPREGPEVALWIGEMLQFALSPCDATLPCLSRQNFLKLDFQKFIILELLIISSSLSLYLSEIQHHLDSIPWVNLNLVCQFSSACTAALQLAFFFFFVGWDLGHSSPPAQAIPTFPALGPGEYVFSESFSPLIANS